MTTAHVSPLLQEPARRPSLEILNMGEQKSEDKDRSVSEAGHKDLIGGMKSAYQPERKESRRASTSKAVWKKVVKGLKIRFLTSTSVSKRSKLIMDKFVELPENGRQKHIGWVRSFGNLFQLHSKRQGSSEMSTFQRNYLIIKDGIAPTISHSPPSILPFAFHKKISKVAQTIRQHCQGTLKVGKSRESVTGASRKSCDSDQKHLCKGFMKAECGNGSEKLDISLLGGSSSSSSSLLGYDPVTSQKLPPSWILRKWKLRGLQKLLRIHPEKELLFHLTDDVDADNPQEKHYSCTIKLENTTSRFVAFKFKCTCPQGYLMRPKHGILAPNATLEVKGVKIGDPVFSSLSKRDLFVIVTLPIPAAVVKQTTETVSASIFDRFQAQCYCEGVLHAVFCRNIADSKLQGKIDAVHGGNVSLTSIPEEDDLER